MFFEDEPEWMRKARTVPLRSTWESRNPPGPIKHDEGHARAGEKQAAMS